MEVILSGAVVVLYHRIEHLRVRLSLTRVEPLMSEGHFLTVAACESAYFGKMQGRPFLLPRQCRPTCSAGKGWMSFPNACLSAYDYLLDVL